MRCLNPILGVGAVMVAMIVATAVPAMGSAAQTAQEDVSQALYQEQPMGDAADRAMAQAMRQTNEGKDGILQESATAVPKTNGVTMGSEAVLLGLGSAALMAASSVVLRRIIR